MIGIGISPMFQDGASLNYPIVLKDGNTVAWYDASKSDTITKDASNFISRWNDRLGSGHDLIQVMGSNQPTLTIDSVYFDGVDNFMKTNTFLLVQPEFIYLVYKNNSNANSAVIFDGFNPDTMSLSRPTPGSAGARLYAGLGSAISAEAVLGLYLIRRCLFNGENSKFITNNFAPKTGNYGNLNGSGFSLGSYGGTSSYQNMNIKEIIIRKVSDNTTSETEIYNYLKTKYSL